MNIYLIEIRKDKDEVSNAINILNSSIDAKICGGSSSWVNSQSNEEAGKCYQGKNSASSNFSKFSDMFKISSNNNYPADKDAKMGNHTSDKISKDTSELSREEKGVMSSVFAKVIEGAEIVEILLM